MLNMRNKHLLPDRRPNSNTPTFEQNEGNQVSRRITVTIPRTKVVCSCVQCTTYPDESLSFHWLTGWAFLTNWSVVLLGHVPWELQRRVRQSSWMKEADKCQHRGLRSKIIDNKKQTSKQLQTNAFKKHFSASICGVSQRRRLGDGRGESKGLMKGRGSGQSEKARKEPY